MISLSLIELTLVAKNRGIEICESKSENEIIKRLSEPEPKIRYSKQRIKEIRKKKLMN